MDYFKVAVSAEAGTAEILMALLAERDYDTFEETSSGLAAYIPAPKFSPQEQQYLQALMPGYQFTYEVEFIPARNWNEEWESNFRPIQIGQFCGVRASFHSPMQGLKHELVIDPKMAFGTGHHETTAMMIEAMEGIPFQGTRVLDFGCGTGILAILAARLGALLVEAIDIETESCLNTKVNAQVNGVRSIAVAQGSLDAAESNQYDVILANINRNVILSNLAELSRKLPAETGILLLSGFILEDEPAMLSALEAAGLEIQQVFRKNNWLAMKAFRKKN